MPTAQEIAAKAKLSPVAKETVEQILPRSVGKAWLSFPSSTLGSTATVEELLEKDRAEHHCFWGPVPFHNHLSHHLFAAYDLGASDELLKDIYAEEEKEPLLPVFTADIMNSVVERKPDVLTRENWTSYLGKEGYYANFLQFFNEEVKRLGPHATYEQYVYSDEASAHGVLMAERLVAAALHSFIQMGYAIEFNSPAMVAQALAQCAVHSPFLPELSTWNNPNDPPPPSSSEPLLKVVAEAYSTGVMDRIMPYDPDATFGKRVKDALTPERCTKLRQLIAKWAPSACSPSPTDDAPDIQPDELAKKAEELTFVATLALAGTGKKGLKPRLDFFLMHILTSSMFVPHLLTSLSTPRAKARLLASYLGVLFTILLARGSPALDADLLMSYTDSPRGPTKEASVENPAALKDSTGNAWTRMLPHALLARDSHTIKAFRALYVGAAQYGSVRSVRGADTLGKSLDGSVFVRTAGVLLDVMGWVAAGQPEGAWDRTALGWDEAWEEERKNNKVNEL